jgi:hypothetical protein
MDKGEAKEMFDALVKSKIKNIVSPPEHDEAVETTDDIIASLRDMATNLVAEVKLKPKKASAETKAKVSGRRKGVAASAKKKVGKKKAAKAKKGYEPSGGGNPYANRGTRGDSPENVPGYGPPSKSNKFFGNGPTEMPQSGYWACTNIAPYTSRCVGKEGEVKIVKINKSYKKAYNQNYANAEADGKTNSVRGIANRKAKKKK